MRNLRRLFRSTAPATGLLTAVALFAGPVAIAQQVAELPQPSPKAHVEQRVGVTDFVVDYSSPGAKNRTIWGELVPYDKIWRAGANAPTTLEASRDFSFGGTKVPAGKYSLLAIPGRAGWTVILNKNLKLQGTLGYHQKDDVARVNVTPTTAEPRERLTFMFSDTTDDSTRLDLEWEKLRVSVPITVETTVPTGASTDKTLGEARRTHFTSARCLLDSGGDLSKAVDTGAWIGSFVGPLSTVYKAAPL